MSRHRFIVLGLTRSRFKTRAAGRQIRTASLVRLDLPHVLAQRLGRQPEISRDVRGAPATASDGSTVFVQGDGRFQAPNGSASGGGPYTLESSAGTAVGSGIWTVDSVQNFVFYGVTASGIVAGEAKLAVHLTGGPLAGDDGTLTIWCVAGGLAPPGKSEGISLVLGQGGEFNESGFGPNFFKAAA